MRFLRLIALSFAALALLAHPMGNFSVSHYTRIEPSRNGVFVTYALDLAEIPSFELLREWKLDSKSSRELLEAAAANQARAWMKNLEFREGERRVEPVLAGTEIAIAEGAGGLAVLRITARLELSARGRLEFEDRNYPERAGWKEIVIASGQGAALLKASHSDRDISRGLTAYPADPSVAPPHDLRASLEWRASRANTTAKPAIVTVTQPLPPATAPVTSSAAPTAQGNAGNVTRNDFLSRMLGSREITMSMILIGLAVAFGLGALHALSPGHGKTIVAAYLVGSRGTARHAAILGATTTFTHTASVFALGLATLFLSQYVVPEKIYPILEFISGLSIVAIGATLFWKRMGKLRAAGHTHHHHHDHDGHHHHEGHHHHHDHHHHDHHHHDHHHHDHPHTHDHGPHGHKHYIEGDITMGSLIALGASGGLVPCPSALVLLLSAIAIGKVGIGLVLLIAFSLGLAAVLTGIGVLVLYAKHLLPESEKASRHPAFRLVPVLSAAVITLIGCVMTAMALGWVQPSGLLG